MSQSDHSAMATLGDNAFSQTIKIIAEWRTDYIILGLVFSERPENQQINLHHNFFKLIHEVLLHVCVCMQTRSGIKLFCILKQEHGN